MRRPILLVAVGLTLGACSKEPQPPAPSVLNNYGHPPRGYDAAYKAISEKECRAYAGLPDYSKAPLGCQRRLQRDRYTAEISVFCQSGDRLKFSLESQEDADNWSYYIYTKDQSLSISKLMLNDSMCADRFWNARKIGKSIQVFVGKSVSE